MCSLEMERIQEVNADCRDGKRRYDTILMGNFMAYPEFQQKFGSYFGEELGWNITGPWQTGLNMASTVGGIFGTLLTIKRPHRF